MSEEKLDEILHKVTKLEQDVGGLKQDVGGLKQDVGGLKQDVEGVRQKQDDMLTAFRAHWADMSTLHRAVRDDLRHFEDRVEGKLSQVNQSIQALKDSIERQDFRSDELGRRIDRLEVREKPPL